MEEFKKLAKEKMEKSIESLRTDFASMRTGRASLSILDNIKVDAYGSQMKIDQVASMAVPESRLITIQPWDPKMIQLIEKAILKSDLGINPTNDGKIIRLAIPQLTEERRKQIVKLAHKKAEESKVAVRNIRRDINEKIKKHGKDNNISKDLIKDAGDELQTITDKYVKKIDEILHHKEAEIMEV